MPEPPALVVPTNLARAGADHLPTSVWLDSLSAAVDRVAHAWSLELGPPYQPGGVTAWVAPVRSAEGEELVLKVGRWHAEAEHEADALRLWDGDGAVRLHRADRDGDSMLLLLERCDPGTDLRGRPEPEQDVVIASILRRLWATPLEAPPFRPLSDLVDIWVEETLARVEQEGHAVDAGHLAAALDLMRQLPRSAGSSVLLCTDLHAGNVLASTREPWLVIDPKPYVGDPAYDVVQHLLNCGERLAADPGGLADRMADLLDLSRERVRLWLFARSVIETWHLDGMPAVTAALAP